MKIMKHNENPNLIEAFRMNYNAIGLERESKVVTGQGNSEK